MTARRFFLASIALDYDTEAVAIGDSNTAGYGVTEEETYISLIAADQGWASFVNSGASSTVMQNTVQNTVDVIGGAMTGNGRDNLQSRIFDYNPRRVFVLYGTNDLRFNDVAYTDSAFQTDLSDSIQLMIASGILAENIFIGSPPLMDSSVFASGSPFDAATAEKFTDYIASAASAAASNGVNYIDVNLWMVNNGGYTLLQADGIHLTVSGHQQVAAAFLSVL